MKDPTQTLPYCGPPPQSGTWFWAWNTDGWLLAVLALAGVAGTAVMWRRGRDGRKRSGGGAFSVAMAAALVAFVSPLCALTVALLTARTLHHIILLSVLAPALALAFPLRRVPVPLSFAAMSLALWLWHLPAVYSAAWDSAGVYWLMQAALIVPAWAFWSVLLARPSLRHATWLVALVGQMGFLGALLTFAPAALYFEHEAFAPAFGLSGLADQQLAGLVMWVPGMVPLAALCALMGWRGLRRQGLVA